MNRNWIMDKRSYTALLERLHERVAVRIADDVQMINVISAVGNNRHYHALQAFRIALGKFASGCILFVKVRELNPQNGGLQLVESAVDAPLHMIIAFGLSIIA